MTTEPTAQRPEQPAPGAAQPPEPVTLNTAEFLRLMGPSLAAYFEAATAAAPPRRSAEPRRSADVFDALLRPSGLASGGQPADLFQSMARAYVAFIAGGFRFWGRVIEASADSVTSAMNGFAELGESRGGRGRARADRFEDLLAGLADLPEDEVARLRAELLRSALSGTGDPGPWRRRHKGKP